MRPRLSRGDERLVALASRAGLVAAVLCLAPAGVGTGERAAAAPLQATVAVDPCDPDLLRTATDALAYGRRGERCEGLYIKEVSGGGGLQVASFTEPAAAFEIARGERLHVAWISPDAAAVRLRAVALQRRIYYRMDVVRDRGPVFEWPADVLVSLGLQPRDVGIVGWAERPIGGRAEEIYVPLRVGKATAPERTGRYVVRVVPAAELAELYVTLAALDPSGRETLVIQRDVPLGMGFYPAERAVSVPLPPLPQPGLYRLRLGATLRRGGPSTNRSIVFYHAKV
jgi:hypothetical protein